MATDGLAKMGQAKLVSKATAAAAAAAAQMPDPQAEAKTAVGLKGLFKLAQDSVKTVDAAH
jgi:hypothetical protein